MAKTKKTDSRLPLIITGYSLYGLLLISVLLSTILPFGALAMNPHVKQENVIYILMALSIGALLPTLIGYLVGNKSIKTKSARRHHFNGMLFGLLALWVMIVVSSLNVLPDRFLSPNASMQMVVTNVIPSIVILIITATIAIMHVRGREASKDVIEYKPFLWTLIASIYGLPLILIAIELFGSNDMAALMMPAVVTLAGLLVYLSLWHKKLSPTQKLAWSAVIVSVALAAVYAIPQGISSIVYLFNPIPTMEDQVAINTTGWSLALIAWITYWFLQVRSLPRLPQDK